MDDNHKPIPNLDYNEGSSVVEIHSAVSREKAEPAAGLEPVSIWAFIAAALVLAGGALYLGAYNGGFDNNNLYAAAYTDKDKMRPEVPGLAGAAEDRPWIDVWMDKGKNVYASCGACHLPTGVGQDAAGFPPLAGSEWVLGGTERLGMILMNGLHGPITVKGKEYGTQVMPAQGALLSPAQMAQVMTYIRRSWGNDASPVTEEMTKAVYEAHSGRTAPWTAADLLAVPEDSMLPGPEVDLQTGLPPGEGGDQPAGEEGA